LKLGNSYNNQERTLAAGYDNGDVKLFDLRNMSLMWETNVKNGVYFFMALKNRFVQLNSTERIFQ